MAGLRLPLRAEGDGEAAVELGAQFVMIRWICGMALSAMSCGMPSRLKAWATAP